MRTRVTLSPAFSFLACLLLAAGFLLSALLGGREGVGALELAQVDPGPPECTSDEYCQREYGDDYLCTAGVEHCEQDPECAGEEVCSEVCWGWCVSTARTEGFSPTQTSPVNCPDVLSACEREPNFQECVLTTKPDCFEEEFESENEEQGSEESEYESTCFDRAMQECQRICADQQMSSCDFCAGKVEHLCAGGGFEESSSRQDGGEEEGCRPFDHEDARWVLEREGRPTTPADVQEMYTEMTHDWLDQVAREHGVQLSLAEAEGFPLCPRDERGPGEFEPEFHAFERGGPGAGGGTTELANVLSKAVNIALLKIGKDPAIQDIVKQLSALIIKAASGDVSIMGEARSLLLALGGTEGFRAEATAMGPTPDIMSYVEEPLSYMEHMISEVVPEVFAYMKEEGINVSVWEKEVAVLTKKLDAVREKCESGDMSCPDQIGMIGEELEAVGNKVDQAAAKSEKLQTVLDQVDEQYAEEFKPPEFMMGPPMYPGMQGQYGPGMMGPPGMMNQGFDPAMLQEKDVCYSKPPEEMGPCLNEIDEKYGFHPMMNQGMGMPRGMEGGFPGEGFGPPGGMGPGMWEGQPPHGDMMEGGREPYGRGPGEGDYGRDWMQEGGDMPYGRGPGEGGYGQYDQGGYGRMGPGGYMGPGGQMGTQGGYRGMMGPDGHMGPGGYMGTTGGYPGMMGTQGAYPQWQGPGGSMGPGGYMGPGGQNSSGMMGSDGQWYGNPPPPPPGGWPSYSGGSNYPSSSGYQYQPSSYPSTGEYHPESGTTSSPPPPPPPPPPPSEGTTTSPPPQ